jgi:hypothetical protein
MNIEEFSKKLVNQIDTEIGPILKKHVKKVKNFRAIQDWFLTHRNLYMKRKETCGTEYL